MIRRAWQRIREQKRLALSAAFVLGLLNVASFAPFGLSWLPIPVLATVLLLIEDRTPRLAGQILFFFGFGMFLLGTHWLYFSLHVFGHAPILLALLLMVLLAAIMAGYFAIMGYLLNRFFIRRSAMRWIVAFPAIWVLQEWIRGWMLSGFPWFALGYSQTDGMLSTYAPLGGVFGVSLVVCMLAGSVVMLICETRRFVRMGSALLPLALLSGAFGFAQVEWTRPTGQQFTVALVQGNVPQDQKWLPENLLPTMLKYWRLTESIPRDADYVIWPEAAIPALYGQLSDSFFADVESDLLHDGQQLITGTLIHEAEDNIYFNSAVVLGDDERHLYHKRHLVPFGEYFPVPDGVRRWLRLMNLPYSDFQEGSGDNLLVAGNASIGMMICYEAVFGNEARDAMPAADFLVNISNDGWFGKLMGPQQHFQIARMRAIENGRWLLRATNTGMTAIVDHLGRIRSIAPTFEPTVLSGQVEVMAGITPYARYGDWPAVLVTGMLLLVATLFRRKMSRA